MTRTGTRSKTGSKAGANKRHNETHQVRGASETEDATDSKAGSLVTERCQEPHEAAGESSAVEEASAADLAPGLDLSNENSFTETEVEKMAAPETATAEEERLRKDREKADKNAIQDLLNSGQEAVLNESKMEQLEQLLDRAGMYTQFLTEQMDGPGIGMPSLETDAEDPAGTSGKRKAGKQGGKGAKRQKQVNATQALLPLMALEMRDYQLRGVRWLVGLYNNGINGILADQMGLGKTVQTIGFFSFLRSHGMNGPFLVVGPLSTLSNWVAEVERWCPSLPALLYHGSKQERAKLRSSRMPTGKEAQKSAEFPVVVTSYEIVIADSKALQRYDWTYIVVDEGHRLKNFNCRLLRELRQIPAANKLLLSGTPLQNNLSELWSLLNFILPDVFSDLASFENWFDFSAVGEAGGNKEIAAREQRSKVVSKLHKLLKPFLLRRVKSDVETNLPPKKEILLYAGMTETQQRLNDELRKGTLDEAMAVMRKQAGGAASSNRGLGKLNNVLMQMRKVCNHPDLITGDNDGTTQYPSSAELREQCGKFELLDRLLTQLHKQGHKVLLFSQMTRMLDLLDTYLEQEGHSVCRLDGSVNWEGRQEAIRAFNEACSNQDVPMQDKSVFCFLLSTRAGGLGINLTSADTVIIYDSDWNPHQDMQAMDRAHRIGQEKPVLVFRLATAHSVEGRLLKRANSKLMLERLVIKQGAFLDDQADKKASNMSAEELLELLSPDQSFNDKAQSGIVDDKMLANLLDRSHMMEGKKAPYNDVGPGWEVIQHGDGTGLLTSVNK